MPKCVISAPNSINYDAQLCSAELVIIKGDIQRINLESINEIQKLGLTKRINSALGTLGWLCRRYVAANPATAQINIDELRKNFKLKRHALLENELEILIKNMPLSLNYYLLTKPTSSIIDMGENIYYRYCAMCHINPNLDSEIPALSLFNMAKQLPQKEFFARMIAGVRGTPKILFHNPLSKEDILGMYYFFLKSDN
jgi:hypothetical protein